jgi:hypothetical protein
MPSLTLSRKFAAFTMTSAALAATLALAACGGGDGGSGDVTGPPPSDDPGNPPPPAHDGPPPVGAVIYALDNGNNLLMFGTESGETISRKVGITGVPILKRMIGIDFRASDGKLYGVGNDSRVYTIDTLTGAATPVGEPFSPKIISSFDIHFGMDFDPATTASGSSPTSWAGTGRSTPTMAPRSQATHRATRWATLMRAVRRTSAASRTSRRRRSRPAGPSG